MRNAKKNYLKGVKGRGHLGDLVVGGRILQLK
jgi:hypothetical protein